MHFLLLRSLCLTLVSCLLTTSLATASSIVLAEVNASSLNIRRTPDVKGERLGAYQRGEEVVVTLRHPDWAMTLLPDQTPAFIAAEYLRIKQVISAEDGSRANPDAPPFIAEVISVGLNVREAPTRKSRVIGWLKRGDRIVASLPFESWALTILDGQRPGYVAARRLKQVQQIATPTDCASEADNFNIDSQPLDFQCQQDSTGRAFQFCSAQLNVTVSSSCLQPLLLNIACDGAFGYKTASGLMTMTSTADSEIQLPLTAGFGAAKTRIDWRPEPNTEDVVRVQLQESSCRLTAVEAP